MSNQLSGPSTSFTEENEFDKAFNDLVRWGLVYDCGKREWSPRTGRYEILWAASDRCNCGYDHNECSDRDCPCKRETDLRYLN